MDRNAGLRRLVGDELAQLEEGPGMPLVAMFAPNRCSLSDPRQVFESDCLARYDGFLDQLLADTVIRVFLEARLTAAHLAQTTLGVLGAAPSASAGAAGGSDCARCESLRR